MKDLLILILMFVILFFIWLSYWHIIEMKDNLALINAQLDQLQFMEIYEVSDY